MIATDGVGGAFVVWSDSRNNSHGSNDDIFVQRVTASGEIAARWPADGVPVSTDPAEQTLSSLSVDALGGVIIAWFDYRNDVPGGTATDIYAQRVLADGTLAPGWPLNGAPVARADGLQAFPIVLPDGSGGAFVTWDDQSGTDIYLQRLSATGGIAPSWPTNGIPICTLPSEQGAPRLTADGAGGVFIVWADFRDGPLAQYAQHVTGNGEIAAGWPVDGKRIVLDRAMREIIPDGTGGVYLSLATLGFTDDDYYLVRFNADGTITPGWPAGGVPVCLAADERNSLRMVSDGSGGVVLTWGDLRDVFDDEIFALRVRPDGTRYPGWPEDGLRLTDNLAFDSFPDLAADGLGGAYLCWEWEFNATGFDRRVKVQHVSGNGAVVSGWPANGLSVPTVVQSGSPRIVEDGSGGAIVAWEDVTEKVRALRLGVNGPVAIQLSLVSAEAEADRVRLVWFAAEGVGLIATVERRTESSDWQRLADIVADGSGRLEYEDRRVVPGTRYAYRLGYKTPEGPMTTSETWVDVPALQLTLRGFTPNPSAGDPVVAFTLARTSPAHLELFDVTGRLVVTREVGSLGPGTHQLNLAQGTRLPAGIYNLRLIQGEQRATARAVVMR